MFRRDQTLTPNPEPKTGEKRGCFPFRFFFFLVVPIRGPPHIALRQRESVKTTLQDPRGRTVRFAGDKTPFDTLQNNRRYNQPPSPPKKKKKKNVCGVVPAILVLGRLLFPGSSNGDICSGGRFHSRGRFPPSLRIKSCVYYFFW